MASLRALGAGASFCLSLVGCVHGAAVRTDGRVALRRVVIYRNGVGYFERHARTTRDGLDFRVRDADVGDFLATLAVMENGRDAVASAAFRSPNASDRSHSNDGTRIVHLDTAATGRDIAIGYTVEAPIWRPSYRLVFDGRGHGELQVWGLVQNQSGEDWHDVRLTLVAGSPVAFRADIATARTPPRPTVTDEGEVIQTVPSGDTALAQETDVDHDGIPDVADRCPDENEDRDGYDDTDGCPDADNDHDRIADRSDRCPNEPETYNGVDDEDGCPDRGVVLVEENSLQILDHIRYARNSARLAPSSSALLDAVAATLRGNPQLTRIEIDGHARADERGSANRSASSLAMARADAVVAALAARGIPSSRLTTRSSIDADGSNEGRVEFHVMDVSAAPAPARVEPAVAAHVTLTPSSARANAALAAAPTSAATASYPLPRGVDIANGHASMLLLATIPMPDDRLYLFAPDPSVPTSSNHPFRIARFRNTTHAQLERGAVALFAANEFLGQGLLEPLPAGATATVPFAVERGVIVDATTTQRLEGARLLAMHRDTVTIERANVTRTSYVARNGEDREVQILVRLRLAEGTNLVSPPRGTESVEHAALVPLRVGARSTSTQIVRTDAPLTTQVRLDDDLAAEAIAQFLAEGHVDPATAGTLRSVLDLRSQLAAMREERRGLETRRADLVRAADETRMNLLTLERSHGGGALRGQLDSRLARTATEIDSLMQRMVAIDARVTESRMQMNELVRTIDVSADAGT